MFKKKNKESTLEQLDQDKEAKKEEADKEEILVGKQEKKESEITTKDIVLNMTEIEYRTWVIDALSEILYRLRGQNE